MAVCLGGKVHSLSIDPDWDDGPRREGDVEVHWPEAIAAEVVPKSIQVALAGPVAEMIYTGDPFHPALVAEWSNDWETAWNLARRTFADEKRRMRFLESETRSVYQMLHRDRIWQAIAALADEVLAHEILESEEIHNTIQRWL